METPTHVRLLRDCGHGDWKSVAARGGRPTIPKGTVVPVIREFANLYGRFWRVQGPSGDVYDIEQYKCEPTCSTCKTAQNVEAARAEDE
jgi:hypothetical protein